MKFNPLQSRQEPVAVKPSDPQGQGGASAIPIYSPQTVFSTDSPPPPPRTKYQDWCARVAWFAMIVMLWTGFRSLPYFPLTTWRMMSFVFLAASFPFYKYAFRLKEIKIMVFIQAMLVGGFFLRTLIIRENILLEFSQIFAVTTALMVAPATAGLWYYNQRTTMRAVALSIFISIGYQAFQLVTYYATGRGEYWPTLFIDIHGITVNFFRIVGGFYGASGFMHESGHLAIFIGPQLLLMFIVWHYRRLVGTRIYLQIAVCLWSLLMTLSMGGFLQITFFALTFCLIADNSAVAVTRLVKILAVALVAGVVLYFINPRFLDAIVGHVLERTDEVTEGASARQLYGSEFLWEKFFESPRNTIFGIGLGVTLQELGANPNVLIALTYVTHGIVLATIMFISYLTPIFRLIFVYKKPLFAIPIIAIGVHLSMAYGTYRWPSFWVTIALSICYGSTFGMGAIPLQNQASANTPQQMSNSMQPILPQQPTSQPTPPPRRQPSPPLQRPSMRGKPGSLTPVNRN